MKGYFDYSLYSLNGDKIDNKKLKFVIDREYIESSKRFDYRLKFLVNRINVKGTDEKVLSMEGYEDSQYLHLYHIPSLNHEKITNKDFLSLYEKFLKRDFNSDKDSFYYLFPLGMRDSTQKLINFQYQAIECPLKVVENQITGYGIIAFTKDKDDIIDPNKVFFYRTSFFERLNIDYEIKSENNKLTIKFLDTLNLQSLKRNKDDDLLDINVIYSNHYIYSYSNVNLLEDGKYILNPKKKSQFKKTLSREFKNTDFYYSLMFKNPEANKFFILNDKTPIVSDQEASKELKHELICPICLKHTIKTLPKDKGSDYLCSSHDNKKENDVADEFTFPAMNHFSDLDKKEKIAMVNNITDERKIFCIDYTSRDVANPVIIPKKYYINSKKIPNIFVGLLGRPSSGKSVYLSSIFGLQGGNQANLSYLNAFTSKFNFTYSLEPLNGLRQQVLKEQINKVSIEKLNQLFSTDDYSPVNYDNPPYGIFRMEQGKALARTEKNWIILPFILTSENNNLIISDLSGENSEGNNDEITENLQKCDAYIIMVGPNDQSFEDTFNKVLKAKEKGSSSVKPLCIVFSKFDVMTNEFSSSSQVNVDDTIDLINQSSYKNSLLEQNIIKSSKEIKAYIEEHKSLYQGVNFETIESNFKNVRYFALSSIGLSSIINETSKKDNNFNIDYYSLPFRGELPLLYILAMKGLI